MLVAERAARQQAEAAAAQAQAEAANAVADRSSNEALIAHLKLEIEKLRRELYGQRSERKARLLDQTGAAAGGAGSVGDRGRAGGRAARPKTHDGSVVHAQAAGRASRSPSICRASASSLPAPTSCPCCGSAKLSKLGEDVTETLEVVPRQWKVIQTVREKFSCRDCETITQPPAPFHVTPRGLAGPSLLAMILFEKFGQHQPLNRQSERYPARGHRSQPVDAGRPGRRLRRRRCSRCIDADRGHVLAAERLHGDDTTVPILAKGKTVTGRHLDLCPRRPAVRRAARRRRRVLLRSRDRRGEHPEQHLASLHRHPAGRCL